jgi:hypothetical protein
MENANRAGCFHDPNTVPNISFSQDQSAHTLTIVSADASASWANIKQTTTGTGCSVKFQGTTTVSSGSTVAASSVGAGDFLTVSTTSTSPASCTVSLTYTTVNQLLGTWNFTF